ncbi:MAG: DUF6434 domain-containing protein [Pseudomonadota bacterium]
MAHRDRSARPAIETITSEAELRRWYWLKSELEAEAKRVGVRTTGGKFTILDRLCHRLETGEQSWPGDVRHRPKSKFDWHSAPLSPETVITDSYKNSQNVRRFFKSQVGEGFNFSIPLMDWMRTNTGKTLADAVEAYHALQAQARAPGARSTIARDNQFNQYTRDFLADNPGAGLDAVRKYWALKTALPSEDGRHRYERSDLKLG